MHCRSNPFLKLRGKDVSFRPEEVIGAPGRPIDAVYVVHTGLLSAVVELQDGQRIETAMLGPGCLVGGAIAFGISRWVNCIVGQIGGTAWAVRSEHFVAAVEQDRDLERLVGEHQEWLSIQAQQVAACNARHAMEARLATWLLRAHELSGSTALPFTQDFIADMLGVQRASLSSRAAALKEAKIIDYRRGKIVVCNKASLEQHACECYGRIPDLQAAVFGFRADTPVKSEAVL